MYAHTHRRNYFFCTVFPVDGSMTSQCQQTIEKDPSAISEWRTMRTRRGRTHKYIVLHYTWYITQVSCLSPADRLVCKLQCLDFTHTHTLVEDLENVFGHRIIWFQYVCHKQLLILARQQKDFLALLRSAVGQRAHHFLNRAEKIEIYAFIHSA